MVKVKKMRKILSYLAVLSLSLFLLLSYLYSQKYVQDGANTATTGIILKQTLNLKEYKRVSSGLGVWGKYDRYSRSDRHDDVLTIYCNNWCEKDN